MARMALLAVLVLCSAAALADAGRAVVVHERRRPAAASDWLLQPPAEAPGAPAPYAARSSSGRESTAAGAFVDVLWFVLKWANDVAFAAAAAAGGGRKDH